MNTLQLINWIAFLFVTAYAFYLFAYVVKTRYEFIKLGKKVEFDHTVQERIKAVLINVFGQKKLLKDKKSGIIHVMFFYGFILVQFGAIDFIWKGLAPGSHLPLGPLYPGFTFFQEIVTLMILIAVVWAFYRRYVEKLVRLKRGFKSGLVLLFIGGLMLSVLLGNAAEIIWHDMPYEWTAPIASGLAYLIGFVGKTGAAVIFFICWWIHLLFLLTFLVYVPQSKHAHLIAGPLNVWLGRRDKVGKLSSINFEDESQEVFGVNKIEEFNQKQLVDLYACVECGRCTNVCPATGTGKMLSPMDLIVKLRDHLTEKGAVVTSRTPWMPAYAFAGTAGNQLAYASRSEGAQETAAAGYDVSMIGDVITEEEIWACTTCRNCEDQCPVMNEHVDKIIDMRRYLVLTEGKMESDAKRAIQNIEKQGNPWGISKKERENWRDLRDDVHIPTVKEMEKAGEEFEYLFWVSSMGSYDNRSQKIALSLANIMNAAGIKFAILGNKEKNSGDTPRRLGNEFLYQEMAAANVALFEKHNVKKIITIDPHAYNTFKNEYPEFGSTAEVYHHTELLAQWIKEGRIKPTHAVNETITYHDSCYLGRYNEVYEPPREILKAIPGVNLVEMDRNRQNGMCCGAGGGLMWTEEKAGSRVNVARTEQALAVNPTMIGSGCPFCLTMLSDGTKAKEVEEQVQTLDVVEILEKSVFGNAKEKVLQ
ncbi:(Fe-S)-binding protein [Fictibacillus aquaticus]|uniref:4Fe-4S ferredoxin-type domain-containing protein n=1 Tax=Fictibacillus aquaticus TaxID=2021314 RepID=A0A235F812_9BACL|nr:heterodisulfide reductase-related iron-sulfur binding cluster [Fictibacillus aquaticus]OYD57398.1 hypothetical protein CGZ90_12005 [Fictibacillus aquaticus]